MQRYYRINNTYALFLAVLFISCDPPVQQQTVPQKDPVSEQFLKANQYMQRRHQDHISSFVDRVGWDASVTSSGLWIVENKPGNGKAIEVGSRVTFAFESILLDGTPCYNATEQSPKAITLGQGEVVSGIEEGLLFLSQGAEGTFLIPPHLAHGNFGDRDKIPGNTVIIYHVKVIEVQ